MQRAPEGHPMQYANPSGSSTTDPQVATPPPFNIEAEQGVLGALLLWNDAREDVPFLQAEHFWDDLHKAIFRAICDAAASGQRANPVTLRRQFEKAPDVNGGETVPQYLVRLGVHQAIPRPQVKDYARLVTDLHARRNLILIGEEMKAAAVDSNLDFPPIEIIEETEARLFSLAQDVAAEKSTVMTFGEAAQQFTKAAYEIADGKQIGLRTGLVDLDLKLVGPNRTDFIVLAGRPSMGKTALATNIAFHIANTQGPVDFYSLEMSAEQLAARVLGERIGVASSKIRSGKASPDQLKRMLEEAQSLSSVPLHIDQTGGISIAQLAARARRRKRKHGTVLIVVDYLQLMQASRKGSGSRVQDVSEITTGLKALAKELETPILALSQLSRNVEHRDNKRPQLSDLRESGSIEQDADTVLFVFREEYYAEREQPSVTDSNAYADWQAKLSAVAGKAEIIIGKQRHGELAIIPVAFSGELTRFSNLAREAR